MSGTVFLGITQKKNSIDDSIRNFTRLQMKQPMLPFAVPAFSVPSFRTLPVPRPSFGSPSVVPPGSVPAMITFNGSKTTVPVAVPSSGSTTIISLVDDAARRGITAIAPGVMYGRSFLDRVTIVGPDGSTTTTYGEGQQYPLSTLDNAILHGASRIDIELSSKSQTWVPPAAPQFSTPVSGFLIAPPLNVRAGIALSADNDDGIYRPAIALTSPLFSEKMIHASPIQGTAAVDISSGMRMITNLADVAPTLPYIRATFPGSGNLEMMENSNLLNPKRGNVWTNLIPL